MKNYLLWSVVLAAMIVAAAVSVPGGSIAQTAYSLIENAGTALTRRPTLNCSTGTTCTDDPTNNRTLITASGSSGVPVQVNGSAIGTATTINFAAGTNVTQSGAASGGRVTVTTNSSGSGGSGALTLISNRTLSGAASSVSFSGIPGTYTDLILTLTARGDAASDTIAVSLQFNGDAGNNYTYGSFFSSGNGSTPSNNGSTGQSSAFVQNITAASGGSLPIASFSTTTIPLYAGTTFTKMAQTIFQANYGSSLNQFNTQLGLQQSYWNSTAAITSLTISASSGNFVAGSVFELFGRS